MRPERILAVDVETTGLDPAKDEIVEVGWCLAEPHFSRIIAAGAWLVGRVAVSPETAELTGIEQEWTEEFGSDDATIRAGLLALTGSPALVGYVAHNAAFDRAFLTKRFPGVFRPGVRWIDTMTDLPFEKEPESRKLKHLAFDAGLFSTVPHRALFDAVLVAQLVGRFNFLEVCDRADSPSVFVQALVSYEDRQKAKDLRFSWEKVDGVERTFPKAWMKRVKAVDLGQLDSAAVAAGIRIKTIA